LPGTPSSRRLGLIATAFRPTDSPPLACSPCPRPTTSKE
jgi:hypothetical protein